MFKLVRQIVRAGICTEAPPDAGALQAGASALHQEVLTILGRALAIRQVDAGSCNGCELEIHA
ncbi:MAG: formate hydrogenlyase, partial [Burkholderiales bacterium]